MIQFGSMSITLLLGALYGALFAALLWWIRRNCAPNRFLAMLLIVIAMRSFPYIIGYAGYYDAYPWLSFAPYNASLAFGPLLYFYVTCLSSVDSRPPRNWWRHFLPVALQLIYYCIVFTFSIEHKNRWDSDVQVPWVGPFEQLATFLSIGFYWMLSYKHYRAYQQWLVQNVSDREDHHLEWIRNFLIALAITLLLWAGLAAFERWGTSLNYFQRYPLYVWLAVLTYYLGTEGYRHASHHYPTWIVADPTATDISANTNASIATALGVAGQSLNNIAQAPPIISVRDWRAQSESWRKAIETHAWWKDPELSLTSLARKLGTNTSDLSRAINDGLGINFNELINRMRVAAVCKALANPEESRSLLDIAFEAGFSSKASFNRSFKIIAGETPSAYRARLSPSTHEPVSAES
jgi:AraC-like DNA-binding protein